MCKIMKKISNAIAFLCLALTACQATSSITTTSSYIDKTQVNVTSLPQTSITNQKINSPSDLSRNNLEALRNTDNNEQNLITKFGNIEIDKKIEELEKLISSQKNEISNLKNKIAENSGDHSMTFAVWAGIILAAVAVLVTILGVCLAIFSFFGYRNIMTSAQSIATEKASEKATEVATDVANNITPDATKQVLIRLIEDGKFNQIIRNEVETVTYRGIAFQDNNEDIE